MNLAIMDEVLLPLELAPADAEQLLRLVKNLHLLSTRNADCLSEGALPDDDDDLYWYTIL